ncbi:unnamed protein product [Symbiodinium natans]|uniref:ASCH domain-containing protein n=1 Tax=Symbiodinium natans TaxID=878477 RepID=A0A812KJI9_9DINO|nr:unnamed protein product [Symbiodinium natans]
MSISHPDAEGQGQIQVPQQALVIQSPWTELIFQGQKTWELRGRNLKKRGRVAIAASRTGTLVGEVDFVDAFPVGKKVDDTWQPYSERLLDKERFFLLPENIQHHQVRKPSRMKYKTVYAWIMENPIKYIPSIQYEPVQGPLWPKLTPSVRQRISKRRREGLEHDDKKSKKNKIDGSTDKIE